MFDRTISSLSFARDERSESKGRSPLVQIAVKELMRRLFYLLFIFFIIITSFFSAKVFAKEPIKILLFYSTHCHPCQEVKEKILPLIKQRYKENIRIEELNTEQADNYLRFLNLQEQYNWDREQSAVPTIVINGKFLVGSEEIERYLGLEIETALSFRGYNFALKKKSAPDLISRFKLIRPLGVISAGLIDGINPCAFTVIIFFISFLALQGYSRYQVLIIGLFFILAVFIIYVLIGLGLFSFLFQLKAYWIVVEILYIVASLLCFILAGLAFYDFIKFRKTRQTQNLVLQLPPGLKHRIHRIIGFYYRKDVNRRNTLRLIISAFVVGCFVSLFEAVCTGQVYLPTIVFVLKTTPLKFKAFFYLFIYNLMFIFPLCIILLFALWRTSSEQFSKFAQRHMGGIKILMATLFLSLGLLLLILK